MKIEIRPARGFRPFDIEGMSFQVKAILFGGDRISCCDEVVVGLDEGGTIIAAASIAPKGEECSGEPTIVGLWVHPDHRRKRLGTQVFEAAVRRMVERDLTPVRVDVLSEGMAKVLAAMNPELREIVTIGINDPATGGMFG